MRNIFIPMQLRCARQRAKKTLRQVSDDLNISLSYLSEIERGCTIPSLKILIEMSDYYNLRIDHFFSFFAGG
jgi:transcriptional regulator with XRE-family HTH domain